MPDSLAPLDFALGETADADRHTTARFAADRIALTATTIDAINAPPPRVLGSHERVRPARIPDGGGMGGIGMRCLDHVVAMEELIRASASIGLSYDADSNLCVNQLRRWGTDERQSRHLRKLITGEQSGAMAMGEAGSGSHVLSMKLRADKRGDRYEPSGNKFSITNAPHADTLVVCANTEPDVGSGSVTTFISEESISRFHSADKLDKMRMRESGADVSVFEDFEVPEGHVMGGLGGCAVVLPSGLDYERAVLAARPLGIMQACLDVLPPHVRARKQFGWFHLMQGKVADVYVAFNSARAYVYIVAKAFGAGRSTQYDATILLVSENAVKVRLDAIQALGAEGRTKCCPVARLLRDAKHHDNGAGANKMCRFLTGRELVGAG